MSNLVMGILLGGGASLGGAGLALLTVAVVYWLVG